jgi:MFS family permease
MQPEKLNYGYLIFQSMNAAIGFLVLGYSFSYFNVFTKITHQQYLHYDKHVIKNEDLFNSLVSGLIPFGAIFGSIMINPLASKGRRLAMMVTNLVLVLGVCITLIFDMYALIIGRLIIGLWVGAYVTVCPLYISEIAPPSISGSLGSFNQMGAVTGVLFGFTIAFAVPLPDDKDAKTTKIWRLVFAIPAIFGIVQFLLLLLVFRKDTPLFLMKKEAKNNKVINDPSQQEDDVVNSQQRISPPQDSIHEVPEIPSENQEENLSSENSNKTPKIPSSPEGKLLNSPLPSMMTKQSSTQNAPKEDQSGKAPWSAHYKKALLICSLISVFHQTTGINGVIFFSNEIFTDGEDGNDAEMRARLGTFFIGIVGCLGTFTVIFMLKWTGRVILMSVGEVVLGTWLLLSGIMALADVPEAIILFTLVFIFFFNISIGPILWLYSSEVLDEFGCSIVGLINMLFTWIFGTFSNLGKFLECYRNYFNSESLVVKLFSHIYRVQVSNSSRNVFRASSNPGTVLPVSDLLCKRDKREN